MMTDGAEVTKGNGLVYRATRRPAERGLVSELGLILSIVIVIIVLLLSQEDTEVGTAP